MEKLRQRATEALTTIVDTIEEAVRAAPNGLRNSEVATLLGLESDVNGGQRNHLTHGLLAKLCAERKLVREKVGSAVFYKSSGHRP